MHVHSGLLKLLGSGNRNPDCVYIRTLRCIFVLPDTILDTEKSDWNDWHTNTGKYEGWRIQTHPLLQRRVFGVCQVLRPSNDNWLYGPIVPLDGVSTILVQLTFTMRRCNEHPDPRALKHCGESLELYVLQRNLNPEAIDQFDPDKNRHLFQMIANLTLNEVTWTRPMPVVHNSTNHKADLTDDSPHERVAHYTNRLITIGSHVVVAIRDRGSCSTLRRVHLGFLTCPRLQTNFIQFPRTTTTETGQTQFVQGECVPGAVSNSEAHMPGLICLPDGRWFSSSANKSLVNFPTTHSSDGSVTKEESKCLCLPGFGLAVNQQSKELICRACGANEYKTKLGPLPCRTCPKNSHNTGVHSTLRQRRVARSTSAKIQTSQSELMSQLHSPVVSVELQRIPVETQPCVCLAEYFRHPELDTEDSPCTIHVHVTNITMEFITASTVNETFTPMRSLPRKSSTIGRRSNESPVAAGRLVRVQWNRPEDAMLQRLKVVRTIWNAPITGQQRVGGGASTANRWSTGAILEYQVYVWMRGERSDGTMELKPILIHFLSENVVYLTDLPEGARFVVAIRPRTIHGWGRFARKKFDFSRKNEIGSSKSVKDPMIAQKGFDGDDVHMTQTDLTINGTLTRRRDMSTGVRITWLAVLCTLALCALLVLILFLRFRRRWTHTSWFSTMNGFGRHGKENLEETVDQVEPCKPLNSDELIAELRMEDEEALSVEQKSLDNVENAKSFNGSNGDMKHQQPHQNQPEQQQEEQKEQPKEKQEEKEEKEQQREKQLEVHDINTQIPEEIQPNCVVSGPVKFDLTYQNTHAFEREAGLAGEVEPDRIKIRTTIGIGEFGEVCAGTMDEKFVVAVKMLRPDVSEKTRSDFLKEAGTMQKLSHPNVVRLLAVVTETEPRMLITEFMHKGSLDKYLQDSSGNIGSQELLQMLVEICEGMKYISGLDYIHRDLAARNVLLNEAGTCKISDFGLTRKIDEKLVDDAYTLSCGKVPIRWTAPEAVIYRRFSVASDVWSFGIVSWEVFSHGQRPYWDWTNQAVISMLQTGYRLPAPTGCPTGVYRLMRECWSVETNQRPSFGTISTQITSLIHAMTKCDKSLLGHVTANRPIVNLCQSQMNGHRDMATHYYSRAPMNHIRAPMYAKTQTLPAYRNMPSAWPVSTQSNGYLSHNMNPIPHNRGLRGVPVPYAGFPRNAAISNGTNGTNSNRLNGNGDLNRRWSSGFSIHTNPGAGLTR